jgi:hypothetical protein
MLAPTFPASAIGFGNPGPALRRPWLTWLKSKALTPGMRAFHDWLVQTLKTDEETQ